jgi:hypothetical protein
MPNFPGSQNVLPGVFTDVITQSRGVSVPGGIRVAAIIGEGSTDETVVSHANGGGKDGLDPTYTTTTGQTGRYFQLGNYPLISNRTTLYKNGIPLVGLEALIDSNPFSNKYDYRIDITTGKVQLQAAHLVDQGGSYYSTVSTNTGLGTIANLTLVNTNAPPETWTIRCSTVQRTTLNAPVASTASFIAYGSVSGALVDANGNPYVWIANGSVVSNGVLSFSITESSTFVPGDAFTVQVASGVLVRSDTLTANYIPSTTLNDPLFLQGMGDVMKRHGMPSVANNLSLGCQLAFANGAPGVITLQAAPAMPRRTSYSLATSVNSLALNDDEFIFPFPLGVTPDYNSNIHFFVNNPATNVETQILPNKLAYYLLDTAGNQTTHAFIQDTVPAPSGHSYFYTVKQSFETLNYGADGYFNRNTAYRNQATFSSVSSTFDSSYVGKVLKIFESNNSANYGLFNVTAVTNGSLYAIADGSTISTLTMNPSYLSDFVNETAITFSVIDPVTGLTVASSSGTDGYVNTSGVGTGTGTFGSVSVNFAALNVNGKRLKISTSTVGTASYPVGNLGLYDIIAVAGHGITIQKAVVNETLLNFEVLDPTLTSNYLVINKNVVPNGYGLRVTIVNSKDAAYFDAGWINALTALQVVECDIVVPLPKQTISVIFQNTLSHCLTMSNIRNKKERVMFSGAINGLTPDNVIGNKLAAVEDIGILEGIQGYTVTDVLAGNVEDLANYSVPNAFGTTFRNTYFYPDQIVVQAGSSNVVIDGFYQAAAAAGYESADIRLENPLTNKTLSGYTILRNKMFSQTVLQNLAAAGVCTLQPVAGGGKVVWGVTTTQSGYPEEQEISIVFIRDRVAKILRSGFAGYIGTAESADTPAILNTRAIILLNSLVSQGLITQYKDLSVARDSVDPRQWNIGVRVQPTYPVNFIYIKVGLGQL